jgi:hypothetical protein
MLKLSPQFYIYTFQFNHTVSEFTNLFANPEFDADDLFRR